MKVIVLCNVKLMSCVLVLGVAVAQERSMLSGNQKVVGLIPGSLLPACQKYLGQDIEHQVASYAFIGVRLCDF